MRHDTELRDEGLRWLAGRVAWERQLDRLRTAADGQEPVVAEVVAPAPVPVRIAA